MAQLVAHLLCKQEPTTQ